MYMQVGRLDDDRPDADLSPQELATRYHRLAVAIGWRWAKRFDRDPEDTIGAASLGLVMASVQWERQGRFAAYAHSWIRGRIINEMGFHKRAVETTDCLEWVVAPEHEDTDALDRAMATLSPREIDAVCRVVGYEETPTEAAPAIGTSRWTVVRAVDSGLAKLRQAMAS